MSIKTYSVTGNTYAHKDEIKAVGGTWDKDNKRWLLKIQDKGFKRNDGALYHLRKLSGLRIEQVK